MDLPIREVLMKRIPYFTGDFSYILSINIKRITSKLFASIAHLLETFNIDIQYISIYHSFEARRIKMNKILI